MSVQWELLPRHLGLMGALCCRYHQELCGEPLQCDGAGGWGSATLVPNWLPAPCLTPVDPRSTTSTSTRQVREPPWHLCYVSSACCPQKHWTSLSLCPISAFLSGNNQGRSFSGMIFIANLDTKLASDESNEKRLTYRLWQSGSGLHP